MNIRIGFRENVTTNFKFSRQIVGINYYIFALESAKLGLCYKQCDYFL